MIKHYLYGNCKKSDINVGNRVWIDINQPFLAEGVVVEKKPDEFVYRSVVADVLFYAPYNKVMKVMRGLI